MIWYDMICNEIVWKWDFTEILYIFIYPDVRPLGRERWTKWSSAMILAAYFQSNPIGFQAKFDNPGQLTSVEICVEPSRAKTHHLRHQLWRTLLKIWSALAHFDILIFFSKSHFQPLQRRPPKIGFWITILSRCMMHIIWYNYDTS